VRRLVRRTSAVDELPGRGGSEEGVVEGRALSLELVAAVAFPLGTGLIDAEDGAVLGVAPLVMRDIMAASYLYLS